MAKQKNLLHKTEKAILQLMNKTTVPLTTNEIAEKLDISYTTAKKYVNRLLEKKLLEKK